MDPRLGFSKVASASALLFGYDEPDYYDVFGASLAGRPPASVRQWYEWRVYAQREKGTRKRTDASVPRLFDESDEFRPNPAAAEAKQYGAEFALRAWQGREADSFRWDGELRVHAAMGDYRYVRPSLTLRSTFPLPGPVVGALQAEAGAGFFDGFIRIDVARALVAPTGWRVSFYVDGAL